MDSATLMVFFIAFLTVAITLFSIYIAFGPNSKYLEDGMMNHSHGPGGHTHSHGLFGHSHGPVGHSHSYGSVGHSHNHDRVNSHEYEHKVVFSSAEKKAGDVETAIEEKPTLNV